MLKCCSYHIQVLTALHANQRFYKNTTDKKLHKRKKYRQQTENTNKYRFDQS